MKRYKSRVEANLDICGNCFDGDSSQFFVMENSMDEDILHEYLKCDICACEPICGPRFKSRQSGDVDICEQCFDARLLKINLKALFLTSSL